MSSSTASLVASISLLQMQHCADVPRSQLFLDLLVAVAECLVTEVIELFRGQVSLAVHDCCAHQQWAHVIFHALNAAL